MLFQEKRRKRQPIFFPLLESGSRQRLPQGSKECKFAWLMATGSRERVFALLEDDLHVE
jgi:hypothetical protein